jgi:hypothetical protein
MSYKVQGLSDKAMQFMGQNDELVNLAYEKSRVFARSIDVDGWLRVVLEVGENTTNEQLRKAIPYALELRDRLLDFQGAWMSGGDNLFLEHLSDMQQYGKSYKQLAEMINERVAKYLSDYLAYREEVNNLYPEYKSEFERDFYFFIFSTKLKTNSSALSHANSLLAALGLQSDEITLILKDGLERLKVDQKSFDEDYPISQRKMIEKLRTWREGKKHKSIKAQEHE